MRGLLRLGGGYGCVADGFPFLDDAVAVALGGSTAAPAERGSGEGGPAAGTIVAGPGAVVGQNRVEPGVACLVLAGGALVAGAGADGAGVPVEAGAERPAEVFGALGLADDGEGRAAAVVGLADRVPVDAAPQLLLLLLQGGPRGRCGRRTVFPAAPLPRCRAVGAGALWGTAAVPAAEPGTGIAAAAWRLPEITAPTVRRSGRAFTSHSSSNGHPAAGSPVAMRSWSRSVAPTPLLE